MIKIACVVSEFHSGISNRLLEGVLSESKRQAKYKNTHTYITTYRVPGAIELTFALNQLIKNKSYDAIILLGCVIKGETDHYDYVCSQVSQGIQNLTMKHNTPIIFGVLTVNNYIQALERSGGKKGNKGCYSLVAAIRMIELKESMM